MATITLSWGGWQLQRTTVMVIGHQKGVNTRMRRYRNCGVANAEGYRKALRLMKLAERFGFPVILLIDTPGAYTGLGSGATRPSRGRPRNLFEMAQLRVPILCYIIGEGASGGALGMGAGDRVYVKHLVFGHIAGVMYLPQSFGIHGITKK